jgi:hypothetical protein
VPKANGKTIRKSAKKRGVHAPFLILLYGVNWMPAHLITGTKLIANEIQTRYFYLDGKSGE